MEEKEYNKKLIETFFTYFSEANEIDALDCLSDDVVWQAMGKSGGLPVSGTMDKKAIGDLINTVFKVTQNGLKLIPTGWTFEADRVAVEAEGVALMKEGIEYHNYYHFLIIINDGKINHIKEYMDTLQVFELFVKNA